MAPTKATARWAGVVYFVFMLVAIYREFLFPSFVVLGDPAATMRNIAAAEQTYRLGILASLAPLLTHIVLLAILYRLFKEVDEIQTVMMILFAAIGVAVAVGNLHRKFMPLVIMDGADYFSVIQRQQLEAWGLGFLRYHSSGIGLTSIFWGLWLFPFGVLVYKSRFLPRVLGVLLIVAGVGYVVSSVTAVAWPEQRSAVTRFMMPLYFGEVPIIFWLLLKGARLPQRAEPRLRAAG